MANVQYYIETAAGDRVHRAGVCFGGYSDHLIKAQFARRGRDAPIVWWRTQYRLDPRAVFYTETDLSERKTMLRAFHQMYDDWCDPEQIWIEKYSNGQYKNVTFTAAVPFYALVNMCSILRMKADMPAFIHHWEQLEKLFKYKGYTPNPWTMYHMAVSCSGPANSKNRDWLSDPWIYPGSNTGHMPYDSNWVSIDEVKWMQRWHSGNLREGYVKSDESGISVRKSLPSLWSELKENKCVSYYGREAHFTGRSSKYTKNWMTVEAEARDIIKETPALPRSDVYFRLYGQSSAEKIRLNLLDFIDEVIIPNNL